MGGSILCMGFLLPGQLEKPQLLIGENALVSVETDGLNMVTKNIYYRLQ